MNDLVPNPALYNVPWIARDFNGMPVRLFGRSGLRISNIGLGTWKFGYPDTGDASRVDEPTAFKILDRAIELGVTHWDTANRYNNGSGNCERILGKWLRANPDQRRNIVLATKIFGGMDGRTPNHSQSSRLNVLESTYACLRRMQVEAIDIMYYHGYDPTTPIEESLEAMEDLIQRDLVRYFAVSNFTVDQLRAYESAARSISSRVLVHSVQNNFDILNGELAGYPGVLDYCARTGISFIAWSPLGRGLLTNRYLDPAKAAKGDRLVDEGTFEKDTAPEKMERLRRLAALASESELSVSQLTLAYMLTLPGMGGIIPSSTSVKQLEENARAGTVTLTDEQLLRIRQAIA